MKMYELRLFSPRIPVLHFYPNLGFEVITLEIRIREGDTDQVL
jgi:hypothetical protein